MPAPQSIRINYQTEHVKCLELKQNLHLLGKHLKEDWISKGVAILITIQTVSKIPKEWECHRFKTIQAIGKKPAITNFNKRKNMY